MAGSRPPSGSNEQVLGEDLATLRPPGQGRPHPAPRSGPAGSSEAGIRGRPRAACLGAVWAGSHENPTGLRPAASGRPHCSGHPGPSQG